MLRSHASIRSVSFALETQVFYVPRTCPFRLGFTSRELEAGKEASRAHRMQYPNLPKFTYFDDPAMAAAADRAASAAYAEAFAAASAAPPPMDSITVQPGRRRSSHSLAGLYPSPNPAAAVAQAVAAATAAAAASWSPQAPSPGRTRRLGMTVPTAAREVNPDKRARDPSPLSMRQLLGAWLKSAGTSDTTVHAQSTNLPPGLGLQRYDSITDATTRFGSLRPGSNAPCHALPVAVTV